jgi:hypothetical protein
MLDQSFYMTADGEEAQIEPIECDDICKSLDNAKIAFVKGPASCSDTIGNACDRSNVFKSTMKVAKGSQPFIQADYDDASLENMVTTILKVHHHSIQDSKRRVLSKGLVILVRSLSIVVNHKIVAHGFERIGLYPLDSTK